MPDREKGREKRRVVVLYNTDYDAELIAAADVSAVRESAQAITQAIVSYGLDSQLVGVHGHDLGERIAELCARPPDLVFNLCESLAGDARNEITIPAVMDMLRLPYTGTSALSLGLCLHKERTKEILCARSLATPPYVLVEGQRQADALLASGALDDLAYPYFVKLAHEDASIGIEPSNRVADARALVTRAKELIARYCQPVIAERYIAGREVNATLIGNGDELEILPLHEIDFAAMPTGRPHIVSYAAKWNENHVDYAGTKPVPLRDMAPDVAAAVRDTAARAYRAMGLRDFGRIDLRIDSTGVPWVIDVNPNCDLSPDAGAARSAARSGLSYPDFVGRICEIAWRRHEHSRHPAG